MFTTLVSKQCKLNQNQKEDFSPQKLCLDSFKLKKSLRTPMKENIIKNINKTNLKLNKTSLQLLKLNKTNLLLLKLNKTNLLQLKLTNLLPLKLKPNKMKVLKPLRPEKNRTNLKVLKQNKKNMMKINLKNLALKLKEPIKQSLD